MEHAYAQALWEMLKKGMKPKDAVHALKESLVRHGREGLLPRIGRAFQRLAARESGKQAVTLTVARERDAHAALRSAKPVLEEIGVAAKEVAVAVDDSEIGGWRLEGRETLVNASFKQQLLAMYRKTTDRV